MSAKSSKKVLSMPTPISAKPDFGRIMQDVFLFIFDIFLLFTTRIPLNFLRWLITMVVRGFIFFMLIYHQDQVFAHLKINESATFSAIVYDFFVIVPVLIFLLWYFFTTFTMFLAPFYSGGGFSMSSEDFSEINRFVQWRDNKIRFSSYQDGAQLMRETAVLNNLDQNDPEARKVLGYLNAQMRYMSYSDSLKFLRGKN